jgi:hypothetical protein
MDDNFHDGQTSIYNNECYPGYFNPVPSLMSSMIIVVIMDELANTMSVNLPILGSAP